MPAADTYGGGLSGTAAMTGLSFAVGFGEFFQILSALNSSPWTAENFGGDPVKASSARGYVRQSIIVANLAFGFSAWLQRSPWLLIGSAAASIYAYVLYERALKRAVANGSTSFGTAAPGGARSAMLDWNNPT